MFQWLPVHPLLLASVPALPEGAPALLCDESMVVPSTPLAMWSWWMELPPTFWLKIRGRPVRRGVKYSLARFRDGLRLLEMVT